ncbi:MAG: S1C family serine protease [Candidatus Nanohaloarchaea archaeon]
MKLDSQYQALVLVVVLFTGAVAGGGLVYSSLDARINQLNHKIDSNSGRTVYINYSRENSLTELFKHNDQSVVSIKSFDQGATGGAQGSGFVYSKNGYIITNHHVIDGADRVEVTFTDGTTKRAKIVGSDLYTDLAVLKVDRSDLTPVELGNSSDVEVGQRAIAIGNPFGLRGSMTTGIISQKGRLLPVAGGFSIPNVLQTDASINPGNSGGPLLNIDGEVVGVNTAIETNTGTFSGIGFAIPVDTVKRVVPKIIHNENYQHPWIGVQGIDVNPDIADARDLDKATGFLVVGIDPRGPAVNSTLQVNNKTVNIGGRDVNVGGDIITGINGEKMRGISDILDFLARKAEVGDRVNMTVIRWQDGHNERVNVSLTLAPRPSQKNQ